MQELEIQYLAKSIPSGLEISNSIEILDIFIPKEANHPCLRIRKYGDKYEFTKKVPVDLEKGHFDEQTVDMTKEEFEALKNTDGRVLHKIRFYYDYKGQRTEINVYQGDLKGLVTVDVEFDCHEDLQNFEMPDFCLVDATQDGHIAGGYMCGKTYEEMQEDLEKYNYKKLFI